jgi:uncharacterized protein DUF6538
MCLGSPECYTRVIHMALAMSRPHKHPKTGVYWVRRRVPADLVPVVGKAEVTRSLGTKDAASAPRIQSRRSGVTGTHSPRLRNNGPICEEASRR